MTIILYREISSFVLWSEMSRFQLPIFTVAGIHNTIIRTISYRCSIVRRHIQILPTLFTLLHLGATGAICVHKQLLVAQLCSSVKRCRSCGTCCYVVVDCKKRWGKMMMADQYRKVEQYSPKSSPRGARSPVVSRQDSTGTLKTTISLGTNPSIVHSGPFYLMKEPPGKPI
jgi:hypothetical protein